MTIDAATNSRIESCLDAARACDQALIHVGSSRVLAADADLVSSLNAAARVTTLSADCLGRLPEIRDMVLRVCVEITERAALACARHSTDREIEDCGELLAACAAICAKGTEINMVATRAGKAHMTAHTAH